MEQQFDQSNSGGRVQSREESIREHEAFVENIRRGMARDRVLFYQRAMELAELALNIGGETATATLSADSTSVALSDGRQFDIRTADSQKIFRLLFESYAKGLIEINESWIEEKMGWPDHRQSRNSPLVADTRLRDRVGRATWQRLVKPGSKRGTICLKYPPWRLDSNQTIR